MNTLYFDLLRDWCDALISLQFRGTGDATLEGGFHCRACHILHGRSADAVYPFMVMAKRTGDSKYVDAAKAVFDFGENFVCDDGAVLNDGQGTWKGITVFSATAICEALLVGGHLLDKVTRQKWEQRIKRMGEWLYTNLNEHSITNINYPVTNATALTLLGNYFSRNEYLTQAKHLADYAMEHITENGFLYGEGKPRDAISSLGCRAIDIGYNMEESLPSLVKYAYMVGNENLLDRLSDILLKQLDFMLPDGAWDNSFGTRNNKWTYWGSRTSDGCASAYTLLSARNPVFAEAARRNTELLRACTYDGLLYGGPHYRRRGHHACTHHTFEHANAIAFALEHATNVSTKRTALPCDHAAPLKYYPEINTYKLSSGDYRATVTGYDFNVKNGGHVCGGTLTMLWKYGVGPMIAASVVDYVLVEVQNMQLPRDSYHRSLVPRLERTENNITYSTAYFTAPVMTCEQKDGVVTVTATTGLCDKFLNRLKGDRDGRQYSYTLTANGIQITVKHAEGTDFILPVISGNLEVLCGSIKQCETIFFLTGGFEAREYTIAPGENNTVELMLK